MVLRSVGRPVRGRELQDSGGGTWDMQITQNLPVTDQNFASEPDSGGL